ncbi:hypothetical protein [Vibrio sp. HA2012]|uniref:hypothetical protein n=1 Tax=Vibrio sp. HA2012 TaxID=1971595 RepID=UPI0018E1EEC7|nr:hypothetical protein [Vibrio sp. HA2012]
MTNNHTEITEPLIIKDSRIKELLGVSQPTLWRLTHNFGLPKPIPGMKGCRPYAAFRDWAVEQGMIKPGQVIPLE